MRSESTLKACKQSLCVLHCVFSMRITGRFGTSRVNKYQNLDVLTVFIIIYYKKTQRDIYFEDNRLCPKIDTNA